MRSPRISKIVPREKWFAVVLAALFVLMLGCNLLTPYIADDFRYMFSFADWCRMEHLSQIIPSMAAHAQGMNGRLTAHSLVQVSMLFPRGFSILQTRLCAYGWYGGSNG